MMVARPDLPGRAAPARTPKRSRSSKHRFARAGTTAGRLAERGDEPRRTGTKRMAPPSPERRKRMRDKNFAEPQHNIWFQKLQIRGSWKRACWRSRPLNVATRPESGGATHRAFGGFPERAVVKRAVPLPRVHIRTAPRSNASDSVRAIYRRLTSRGRSIIWIGADSANVPRQCCWPEFRPLNHQLGALSDSSTSAYVCRFCTAARAACRNRDVRWNSAINSSRLRKVGRDCVPNRLLHGFGAVALGTRVCSYDTGILPRWTRSGG